MAASPSVLLLDDGELDDVQELLQELDIAFARVRGGAIVEGSPPPRDLLIATPRRISAVAESVADVISPPIRVMVVNEDSNALRAQLRSNGFDYLVRRPVHTEALRLLLMHCIYKGEERRNEPRVAVGFEISFRAGLTTRRATLMDLSIRGCRLLSRTRLDKGKRIKLHIPEALDTGDPIIAPARVVRLEGDKDEYDGAFALGVSFEKLSDETRQALELMIEDRSRGPATLRTGTDDLPRPSEESAGVHRVSALAAPKRVAATPEPTPGPAPGTPTREAPTREAPTRERFEPAAEDAAAGSAMREPAAPAGETEPAPDSQERRQATRSNYPHRIPAFGNRALRVLVGRDLSVGGMRIQPMAELEIGDRLHLAIYGEAGEEPLLVWGSVHRDDGADGLVLLFDPVDGEAAARLERLVSDLPAVESLHDTEAEAMGTVVGEIVEAPAR